MKPNQPAITAKLTIWTGAQIEKEHRPIRTGFRCTFIIENDDEIHDCQIVCNSDEWLKPGITYPEVFVYFLCPEFVLPKIQVGTKFRLRDRQEFAEAEVIHIFD